MINQFFLSTGPRSRPCFLSPQGLPSTTKACPLRRFFPSPIIFPDTTWLTPRASWPPFDDYFGSLWYLSGAVYRLGQCLFFFSPSLWEVSPLGSSFLIFFPLPIFFWSPSHMSMCLDTSLSFLFPVLGTDLFTLPPPNHARRCPVSFPELLPPVPSVKLLTSLIFLLPLDGLLKYEGWYTPAFAVGWAFATLSWSPAPLVIWRWGFFWVI